MPQPGEQDHHNEGSEWHNDRNQNVLQPFRRPWRRTGSLLEKKSDRSAKNTQAHLIPPFSSYDALDGTEVNKKFREILSELVTDIFFRWEFRMKTKSGDIPLLAEEGRLRHLTNVAEPPKRL